MKISFNKEHTNGSFADAALELVAEHGHDPGTRQQAAAHESGHVVVAYALGWTVDGAKLIKHCHPDRVRWGGFTNYTIPGYEEPTYKLIADDPIGAFQIAVSALAGFLGEKLVGLDHPVSSLDERYLAMNIATSLNDVFGIPEGTMESAIGRICQQIIENNRLQFDVIRTHLNRTGRLTRNEAKRMLAHVKHIDLKTIFEGVAP